MMEVRRQKNFPQKVIIKTVTYTKDIHVGRKLISKTTKLNDTYWRKFM